MWMPESLKTRLYQLLRWSERYTKTDMVYLAHGGFWLTFSQVVTTIAAFGASIAFGYLLSKDVYGSYRYILSAAALLSAFSLTGLNTAIVQSVARGFEGSLRDGFCLSMRWSGISVAAAVVAAGYYAFQQNFVLATSFFIIAVTAPFLHASGLFASFINGKKDFKRFGYYAIADNIVPSLAVIGTIFLTQNVVALIAAYLVSSTLMGLLLYWRTLSRYAPEAVHDPELVEYSKKLSLLNILGIITAQIDKVVVFTTLGAVELAVYTFASAFPDQIRGLLKNLNTLMIPRFSENRTTLHSFALGRKTLQLGFLLVGIMGLYILLAPFLYDLFFPKYPESVYFSQLLALIILTSITMIPSSMLVAQKREKELAIMGIISSLIQLAILLPFVYMWGITGAIVARIIGAYMTTGLSFLLLMSAAKKAPLEEH